jgi:hypothetical protein
MEELKEGDCKSRLKAYENIFQLITNPSDKLLVQLSNEMSSYLSDSNLSCQRTALLICERFFKSSSDIDYPSLCNIIIERCLSRTQLTDLSVTLISQCLKESHEAVTSQLFDKF